MKIIGIFFAYLALELFLFVEAGEYIGGLGVVGAVFASMVVGGALVQFYSRQSLARIQKKLQAGHAPTAKLLESFFIFISGVLFVIPGFLSDIVALVLFIPKVRSIFFNAAGKYFANKERQASSGFAGTFVYRSNMRSDGGASTQQKTGQSANETVIDCIADPVTPASHDCPSPVQTEKK